MSVLLNLEIRFLPESFKACIKDIFAFSFFIVPSLLVSWVNCLHSLISSSSENGFVSSVTRPSTKRIILVEYFSASSGLWVTMITNRSLAISWINSIIWIEVAVSNAPVGSSARRISGSFTKARAIATLWHWPPDNWFGFLLYWSAKPTLSSIFFAFSILSSLPIPEIVSANSTFSKIVWWGIKL